MKFLVFLCWFPIAVFAQKETTSFEVDTTMVVSTDRLTPLYPNGQLEMEKFIDTHLQVPTDLKESISMSVRFWVLKTGEIDSISVVRSYSESVDKECIRIVKLMPNWSPATIQGKPIDQLHVISIQFDKKLKVEQEKPASNTKELVAEPTENSQVVVNRLPSFPGGEWAMVAFITKEINYPEKSKVNGESGTVYVRFTVQRDGEIKEVKVVKGVSEQIDKEAVRVVSIMPKWKPGLQNSKPISMSYTVPIHFRL